MRSTHLQGYRNVQFIKNGPDIPTALLQAHEEGSVVFFCGAGISYPAGLPDFRGLVERIYKKLGVSQDPLEAEAFGKERYDAALDLLEHRVAGGRLAVRRVLAEVLVPSLRRKGAFDTHRALIELARDRSSHLRLVTTNFDRIFESVLARSKPPIARFIAPLLPIPKMSRWRGLVYLHGLLPPEPEEHELNRLVVSSGDFGLAYLVERWAARFVSDLFRNYIVCFVGYGINDPVLRYMMDALAADRVMGETTPQAYAFGSFEIGNEPKACIEWGAKWVTPILYEVPVGTGDHSALHHTLIEWARTHRDGVLGKERIVVQYAMAKPTASTREDDFVGRVVWALSDKRGLPAKRFADHDPMPSLEWLEPLTERRFRHCDLVRFGIAPEDDEDARLTFSLVSRPTPYGRAPWMAIAGTPDRGSEWDAVMLHLARWLTRHIHDPKLVLWVAKQGGVMHRQFAWMMNKALSKNPPSPNMQTLWRIVLAGRHARRYCELTSLYEWQARFKRDGLTPTLKAQLLALLSPRVELREPFGLPEGFEDHEEDHEESERLKSLVDWEIELSAEHVHSTLDDLPKNKEWRAALVELLPDFTGLLHETLDLMREVGGADDKHDLSYMHQPSISAHAQNRGFQDWTALIELIRDAWLATLELHPARARLEVERWRNFTYPVFRRLAFFAAAKPNVLTPKEALDLLLANDRWWLWSVESEHEALRLLVGVAPRLDEEESLRLQRAILDGPPPALFNADAKSDDLRRVIDREIWLRLSKLHAAGVALGTDAAGKLETLAREYPEWRLSEDDRDEFPVWSGGDEDWRKRLAVPEGYEELIAWLKEHPSADYWRPDNWSERCKTRPRQAAIALLRLARDGIWIVERWREALQAWSEEATALRAWRCLASTLLRAPDEFLKAAAHTVAWWLQAIAKKFEGNETTWIELIQRMLHVHRLDAVKELDEDPVGTAINHPIGHVIEGALDWWYRRGLRDGQGLNDELSPIFTEVADTSIAAYRHGRVLMAAHVINLFRVDHMWTDRHVLPMFDWEKSAVEARAAWEGFLWSPRLHPPLILAIKRPFLQCAHHYTDLGKHDEQYAGLLTFAALEHGDLFSGSELADATRALPHDGLRRAVHTLRSAVEGAGTQRVEYWRNRVVPYLESTWPKTQDVITPNISEAFARLSVETQGAFPDALGVLRHWLVPLRQPDFVVHKLLESKLCEQFPDEALVFLGAIIGEKPEWPASDLKACLDIIHGARPELATDTRFRRLVELARVWGQG